MTRSFLFFFLILPVFAASQSYRGLSVAGRNLVWVSGSKGTVLRTTNGGKSWDTLNPIGFENKDFRDIHAADKKHAIIMSSGDSGVLLSTRNGGKTWTTIYSDYRKGVFLDAFDVRKNQLLLVGDGIETCKMYIVKANAPFDSGRFSAFTFFTKFSHREFHKGVMPDSTSSYYAASGKNVQWTGKNMFSIIPIMDNKSEFFAVSNNWSWRRGKLLPFKNQKAGGAYGFYQVRKKIVAVGGSFYKPNDGDSAACYSNDGGQNWFPSSTPPGGYRSGVCASRNGKIWICTGPNGTDLSLDAGQNWANLKKLPGYNVCHISGKYLWLAGKAAAGINRIKLRHLKQFL